MRIASQNAIPHQKKRKTKIHSFFITSISLADYVRRK